MLCRKKSGRRVHALVVNGLVEVLDDGTDARHKQAIEDSRTDPQIFWTTCNKLLCYHKPLSTDKHACQQSPTSRRKPHNVCF